MNKSDFPSFTTLLGLCVIAVSGQVHADTATAAVAAADAAAADDGALQSVTVSASRISIAGYDQPTPVTVISEEDLKRDARTDIGDVLRKVPAFGTSSSPFNSTYSNYATNGTEGLNLVSLRQLGANRTLVLVDGQRVVSSNLTTGGVDLTNIPASLIERVDVVTGGASAAWGSDAVAGVVNILLNKRFSGVEVNLEDGNNFQNNHVQRKVELSLGTDFAGDRGHVIVSGSFLDSPDSYFSSDTPGFNFQRLVTNPAYAAGNGQPMLIHASGVGLVQATPGGIITAGPLKGTYFVGNGIPETFNYGNVSSGYYTNGGTPNTLEGEFNLNAFPLKNTTLFALASFKINDAINASLQFNYGSSSAVSNSYSDLYYGTLTIHNDNAFLPAQTAAQMAALGLTTVPLGTSNLNNMTDNGGSVQAGASSLGLPVFDVDRNLYRGVFSLDGRLGDNWTWNAYYQHGQSRTFIDATNNQQSANYLNAVDAVYVTPANVGTSGLQIGSIACRSTLAHPTNGCAPLDVFGIGVASAAAIDYVNGAARDGLNNQVTILKQDVAAASVQGELPIGLPAGQISMAAGGEYRQESGYQQASPMSLAGAFQLGNFVNFYGKYHVDEGFLELNVPLLKDQFVKSLGFNAAGRVTDYSSSGTIETWKLGLTSQLIDDVRVRASWSYDIRAPGLNDLYNEGTPVVNGAIDPHTGQGVSVIAIAQGNQNLKPEKAFTKSAGLVFTPHWVPGLSMSADYYSIDIGDAISTYGVSTIVSQCAAGNQLFCSNLVFGGPNGALSEVLQAPLNAVSVKTSGLDFSQNYQLPLFGGNLSMGTLFNYVYDFTQTALGTSFDAAGSIGPNSAVGGLPKLRGSIQLTYGKGPYSLTVQSRVIGHAYLNNAWGPLNVDDNSVPSVIYWDLRGSYNWNDQIELYAALDNLTNKYPPVTPGSATAGTSFESPIRDSIYDGFGQVYRIGIRAKF